MRVDVKAISRDVGASLEIKTADSPREMALSYQGYTFLNPLEFEGVVSNVGNGVMVLKGMVGTTGTSPCARCLKDVDTRIETAVDVTFRSQYRRDQTAQETPDPDEEEYTYEGYTVLLDNALRDSLILALPYRVLCSTDCKGFCEHCGADLNEGDCKCKDGHENGDTML